MQRSSEFDCGVVDRACQGAIGAHQPGKVAGREDWIGSTRGGEPELPLRGRSGRLMGQAASIKVRWRSGSRVGTGTERDWSSSPPSPACVGGLCDPHHLRFARVRALGRKVGDESGFPCAACTIAAPPLAERGTVVEQVGLDAIKIARPFWERPGHLIESRRVGCRQLPASEISSNVRDLKCRLSKLGGGHS
jgi:hypothetical protein